MLARKRGAIINVGSGYGRIPGGNPFFAICESPESPQPESESRFRSLHMHDGCSHRGCFLME